MHVTSMIAGRRTAWIFAVVPESGLLILGLAAAYLAIVVLVLFRSRL